MSRLAGSVMPLVVAGLLAATVGCAEEPTVPTTPVSSTVSPTPGPTLPPVGAQCRAEATTGQPLRLTNGAGYSIAAVELGSGSSAVVLAHQNDASLCQWLPYGHALAAKGYRVLAFDFAGSGSSTMPKQKTYVEDVRTAVAYLREEGVTKIVIIGASMGATMSVVAAAAIAPPVDGLIALSPPIAFDGVNAEKAAPSLRTPTLYIAGDMDGDYATYATAIDGATPADLGSLLVLTTPQHGIRLLDAEVQATVDARNAIEVFLGQHAPV